MTNHWFDTLAHRLGTGVGRRALVAEGIASVLVLAGSHGTQAGCKKAGKKCEQVL